MELDLQSLFGLLCFMAETLQLPPLPAYTRALLVSQDRRNLFVTPWPLVSRHPPPFFALSVRMQQIYLTLQA
jgi:hypothetical protein